MKIQGLFKKDPVWRQQARPGGRGRESLGGLQRGDDGGAGLSYPGVRLYLVMGSVLLWSRDLAFWNVPVGKGMQQVLEWPLNQRHGGVQGPQQLSDSRKRPRAASEKLLGFPQRMTS